MDNELIELGKRHIKRKRKIFITISIFTSIPVILACILIIFIFLAYDQITIGPYYVLIFIMILPIFIFFLASISIFNKKLKDNDYLLRVGKKIVGKKIKNSEEESI